VLADRYAGQRLNSPNDVVVRSDGMIFFSDPSFGLGPGETGKECSCNDVYRLQPDGDVICLVLQQHLPYFGIDWGCRALDIVFVRSYL